MTDAQSDRQDGQQPDMRTYEDTAGNQTQLDANDAATQQRVQAGELREVPADR